MSPDSGNAERRPIIALVGLSPDLARMVDAILREDGCAPHELPLHGDILSVLGKVRFDAILLDGHPFTNMGALTRAIREHPALCHVPVVVLTARLRDDLAGIPLVEQIEMPFSVDALLHTIRLATHR